MKTNFNTVFLWHVPSFWALILRFNYILSVESVELETELFAKVAIAALGTRVSEQLYRDLVVVVLFGDQTGLEHVAPNSRVFGNPALCTAPEPCHRQHAPYAEAFDFGVEHALEVDLDDPLLRAPPAPLPQLRIEMLYILL